MKSLEKLYAFSETPNLSVDNTAPLTVPLFPFKLSSLALPLNGHQATNPFVGM